MKRVINSLSTIWASAIVMLMMFSNIPELNAATPPVSIELVNNPWELYIGAEVQDNNYLREPAKIAMINAHDINNLFFGYMDQEGNPTGLYQNQTSGLGIRDGKGRDELPDSKNGDIQISDFRIADMIDLKDGHVGIIEYLESTSTNGEVVGYYDFNLPMDSENHFMVSPEDISRVTKEHVWARPND